MRTLTLLCLCLLAGSALAAPVPVDNADFNQAMTGWSFTQRAGVASSIVDASVAGYPHALHTTVTVAPGMQPWEVMLGHRLDAAIAQTDRLRVRVWLRSPEACPVTVRVQLNHAPWTGAFSKGLALTPTWAEYVIDGTAAQAYQLGEAALCFMLGHQTGTVELTGVRVDDDGPANQEPGSFPFVIPIREAAPTFVDVSALNPAPLGDPQRIHVADGHFLDTTGRRVRFLGVSVATGACFPKKEDAEIIAARMHKYGINCVRLHHMDATWSQPGLFYFDTTAVGKPTLTLDPTSLDRLDYLIYQFAQHGIYVDLNLHVSRTWSKENGFPDSDALPPLGKVVAYFEPRAIQLQQQFARDMLTHFNPYTKHRYADDPALALIELNNEDSLVGAATNLLALPPHYRDILSTGWNAYLKARYGTTAAMLAAWNAGAEKPEPLGNSLLTNADFTHGTTDWKQEQQSTAHYAITAEPADALPHAPAGGVLHVSKLTLDGVNWHVQLHQIGLTLEPGKRYTAAFSARADRSRPLAMNVRLDKAPWSNLGLDSAFTISPKWQRFTVSFIATVPEAAHARLSFMLGDSDADLYLADITLQPGGGGVALPTDESVEAATVSLPAIADNAISRDYVGYLMQVEADYITALRGTIRATGATAAITCSQASYGGLAGQWREAQNDWVDAHAYWQHPQFPGKAWDGNNYRIGNSPMAKDAGGGNLLALARLRVAGKPFTVSEYDHPAPSEYAAEAVPEIFSFAAWQDWDGIFLFAYDYAYLGLDRDRLTGYFDQVLHPGKLGFLPAAAQLFLRGIGTPAPGAVTVAVPPAQVAAITTKRAFPWDVAALPDGTHLGTDFLLAHRMATRFAGETLGLTVLPNTPTNSALAWDRKAGIYTYAAPNARILAGILGGTGAVTVDGLTVTVAPSVRNFASLALVSMDGKPVRDAATLLLTAIDKAENRGVQWNPERTTAKQAFQYGPVQAVGVTADVCIPTAARTATVYALDPTGKRALPVPAVVKDGAVCFRITPEYATIWYEIDTPPAR